jgi:hypothetical protein
VINRTVTAVLDAPKNVVFGYLSKIENLPHWATEFAQELRYEDGKAKVVNGLGEFYVSIDAYAASGVIDMYAPIAVQALRNLAGAAGREGSRPPAQHSTAGG